MVIIRDAESIVKRVENAKVRTYLLIHKKLRTFFRLLFLITLILFPFHLLLVDFFVLLLLLLLLLLLFFAPLQVIVFGCGIEASATEAKGTVLLKGNEHY